MGDLDGLKASQSVKLAGADPATGVESYYAQVDSNGRLLVSTDYIPILPSVKQFMKSNVASGSTLYSTYTFTANTAMKEFHVGGRIACEGALSRYLASSYTRLGGFNSSAEVAAWANTSAGSSALLSWAYATDQFVEGTGSAKMTFTQSASNNYPEITYNFSSPTDLSGWRYIKASVRVTVAAGGAQSRTVQIRMTSGTAVRIWSITGTTNTAPFNVEQWQTISGEIESPTSTGGTGTFDINSVNSISLRLTDGGNKTGSIWWDDMQIYGEMDLVDKIYSSGGTTTQLKFDPVVVFNSGEVLIMSIRNNGATTAEIQAETSGVGI